MRYILDSKVHLCFLDSKILKSLNPGVNNIFAPLPSQLSTTDDSPYITIKSPVCSKLNFPKAKLDGRVNWGVAKASDPIPSTCNLYYFEVKILNDGKTKEIEIGIATDKLNYTKNVGYKENCIGYRGNDGKLYEWNQQNAGREYGETFGKDDVIGCGVNSQTKNVFFTKNGMIIGLTNKPFDANKNWFPAVSLHSKNAKVEINFGEDLFLFDICKYL